MFGAQPGTAGFTGSGDFSGSGSVGAFSVGVLGVKLLRDGVHGVDIFFVETGGGGEGADGSAFVPAAAGGTVAGCTVAGWTVARGTVAGGTIAGGTVAAWGTEAGGTVLAAGEAVLLAAGGMLGAAVTRGETAGGFHSEGVGPAGKSGSWASVSPIIDGGHAGIVCSVGGSGGQMSLCVGSSASGCAFGGQLSGADLSGLAAGVGSGSPDASAGAGTVCAQEGAGFCMGTGAFGSVSSSATGSSAGGSVCAHDGVDFCIGRAVLGSASSVAWRASVPRAG
jgi:hypothetical protein